MYPTVLGGYTYMQQKTVAILHILTQKHKPIILIKCELKYFNVLNMFIGITALIYDRRFSEYVTKWEDSPQFTPRRVIMKKTSAIVILVQHNISSAVSVAGAKEGNLSGNLSQAGLLWHFVPDQIGCIHLQCYIHFMSLLAIHSLSHHYGYCGFTRPMITLCS